MSPNDASPSTPPNEKSVSDIVSFVLPRMCFFCFFFFDVEIFNRIRGFSPFFATIVVQGLVLVFRCQNCTSWKSARLSFLVEQHDASEEERASKAPRRVEVC